jgi:thiol:disulfide interchange protein DsbC
MKNIATLYFILSCLIACKPAVTGANDASQEGMLKSTLDKHLKTPINKIEATNIEGVSAVFFENGDVIYSDKTGKNFIAGNFFSIVENKDGSSQIKNITQLFHDENRIKSLKQIDKSDMIVFPAEGKKKTHIYVFTDIDCYYCQKLHKEVPALNKGGVEVRYLGFPRSGLNTPSYKKLQSAWCSEDKLTAMNKLKSRQTVEEKNCDSNAIAQQFELGQKLGVNGTPAIITSTGKLISGYMKANQLVQRLELP